MKVTKLKCPSCGSNINASKTDEIITCDYCGTTCAIEDDTIKIKILDNDLDNTLEAIKVFIDNHEYNKALKKLYSIMDNYPGNPEIWWYLLVCSTLNFDTFLYNLDNISELIDFLIKGKDIPLTNKYDLAISEINNEINECDEYFNKYLKYEKNNKQKENNKNIYEEYKECIVKSIKRIKIKKKVDFWQNKVKLGIRFSIIATVILTYGIIKDSMFLMFIGLFCFIPGLTYLLTYNEERKKHKNIKKYYCYLSDYNYKKYLNKIWIYLLLSIVSFFLEFNFIGVIFLIPTVICIIEYLIYEKILKGEKE